MSELSELQKALAGYTEQHEVDQREIHRLRTDLQTLRLGVDRDCWLWAGDGSDHPESLTCPVVMRADQLRGLLVDREEAFALAAVVAERDQDLAVVRQRLAQSLSRIKIIARGDEPDPSANDDTEAEKAVRELFASFALAFQARNRFEEKLARIQAWADSNDGMEGRDIAGEVKEIIKA